MANWLLKGEPYNVQTLALDAAGDKRGFAYFMEMGLGKTAVTLAEVKDKHSRNLIDIAVVISPASLTRNWKNEAEEWGLELPVHVWPKVPPVDSLVGGCGCLIVMNIEAANGSGGEYLEELVKVFRVYVGIDESTQIKNPQSKRAKKLVEVGKDALFKRALSGAPCIQGPQDLWMQFRFISAITKVPFVVFRNRFCEMGGFRGKKVVGVNKNNSAELDRLIADNSFRARKDQYTDLPPKVYLKRYPELTSAQEKAYKEMKNEFLLYVGGSVVEAPVVVTMLLKLQQISSGFITDSEGVDHNVTDGREIPKALDLKDALEEIDGKAIIVAKFLYSIDYLMAFLSNLQPAVIRGNMTDEQIEDEKARFNGDPACRVIIIQIQTGKYGHTLNGGPEPENHCSHTFYYENSYSLDDRLQSEDRNHRYGQKGSCVTYTDFVSSDIELDAVNALQRKKNVAEYVVDKIRADVVV